MLGHQKDPYVGRILKKSFQGFIHARFYMAIKGSFGPFIRYVQFTETNQELGLLGLSWLRVGFEDVRITNAERTNLRDLWVVTGRVCGCKIVSASVSMLAQSLNRHYYVRATNSASRIFVSCSHVRVHLLCVLLHVKIPFFRSATNNCAAPLHACFFYRLRSTCSHVSI